MSSSGTTPTNPGSGNVQDPHQHSEGAINPAAGADVQAKAEATANPAAPLTATMTDPSPKNT